MKSRNIAVTVVAALAFTFVDLELPRSMACDNPVYRYALQNWPAAEYELLLVQKNELSEQESAAWQSLEKATASSDPRPNLRLRVAAREEVDSLPVEASAKEQFADHSLVLIAPTQGGPPRVAWSGACTPESAARITESPARQELGRRLLDGEAIVWVWVTPGETGEIEQAQTALQDFLVGYAETLAAADASQAASANTAEHKTELTPSKPPIDKSLFWPPRFSSITISADDPQESVFIEMLKSTMQDRWPANEPVVFAIFGRGRVLGGLPASQLNPSSMRSACDFLTGACSCEVKDKNPGDDLLLAADWNSVSPDTASAGLISLVPLEPEPSPPPVEAEPSDAALIDSLSPGERSPQATRRGEAGVRVHRNSPIESLESSRAPLVGLGVAGVVVLVLVVFWGLSMRKS